ADVEADAGLRPEAGIAVAQVVELVEARRAEAGSERRMQARGRAAEEVGGGAAPGGMAAELRVVVVAQPGGENEVLDGFAHRLRPDAGEVDRISRLNQRDGREHAPVGRGGFGDLAFVVGAVLQLDTLR